MFSSTLAVSASASSVMFSKLRHQRLALFGLCVEVKRAVDYTAGDIPVSRVSGVNAERTAEAGGSRLLAGEGHDDPVLAAVLVEGVGRLAEEDVVENGERSGVAGADAKNCEILMLAAGVDGADVLGPCARIPSGTRTAGTKKSFGLLLVLRLFAENRAVSPLFKCGSGFPVDRKV